MPANVRIDSGGAILKKPYRAPQGHLRVDCHATRVGVFRYYNADGTYRDELRHPDQVYDPRSLSSLGGVPVTLLHPPELVTEDNFAKYGTGTVGDEVDAQTNPYVKVSLNVQRRDAQEAIEQGIREVSLGYLTDSIPEIGEWEGQPYTHRQIGVEHQDGHRYIEYNHLAIVPKGRAGKDVKIHFDGIDNLAITNFSTVKNKPTVKPMTTTLRIDEHQSFDGIDPAVASAVTAKFKADAATIAEIQERVNKMLAMIGKAGYESVEDALKALKETIAMLEQVKGENTALEAETEAAKGELEGAKNELAMAKADSANAADITKKVQERIDLLRKVEPIIPATTKLDSLSNQEIIITALKAKYPSINLDGMSEERLNGMWAVASATVDSTEVLRDTVTHARHLDSKEDKVKAAQQGMSARRTAGAKK